MQAFPSLRIARVVLPETRGFLEALIDDGRPLISLTGLCLGLSGAFAIVQSATGHFLPHDIAFLGMSPQELCRVNECRIVHFMFHDRVSFGGSLIAMSMVYLWLAAFPLRSGEPWAWWTLVASGVCGFGSFLSYLGYGYLDSWHAFATLGLLPCFLGGLYFTSFHVFSAPSSGDTSTTNVPWFCPRGTGNWKSLTGAGTACLLLAGIGMIGAGITILGIGMTEVFVSTDLSYMGITRSQLDAINPRLIPLIAHDRAGFGGAVATAGLLLFSSVWHDAASRSLWQALFMAGIAGWGSAIGIHPVIGYTDLTHLAPALLGAVLYFSGLTLTYSPVDTGGADAKH